MRILFLSNYFPPYEKGGYEQLCRDVALRLKARGHEIVVLTSDRGRTGVEQQQEIPVFRLLKLSPDFDSRLGIALQFFLRRKAIEKSNLEILHKVACFHKPDVIFIWNIEGMPRTLATEAELLTESSVAYWLAGYSPAEPDEYWNFWTYPGVSRQGKLLKHLFADFALKQLRFEGKPIKPRMQHTAVVSNYMRKKGFKEGTLPQSAIVIYNGVELEDFHLPARETNGLLKMLQAGRVSSDKGVHIAIEALCNLVHKHNIKHICLTIAGDGPAPYRFRLEELIEHCDLREYVRFLGRVPREKMPQIMRDQDVLLLPTIHQEPFARVVLEAMVAGLLVVAADTGGTKEIVEHRKTGLLCAANDAVSMAEQIRQIVENPQFRQKIARKGQERVVGDFSLDKMVDKLEIFLTKAMYEKTN